MVQNDHSLKRLTVAFTAAALLSACSLLRPHPPTSPPSPEQPVAPQPSPSQPSPAQPARPPPPARENRLSPATHSLVMQARTQVARGDLPAASSTLDRALRIEPNNPLLWIELGRLRLAESDACTPRLHMHRRTRYRAAAIDLTRLVFGAGQSKHRPD